MLRIAAVACAVLLTACFRPTNENTGSTSSSSSSSSGGGGSSSSTAGSSSGGGGGLVDPAPNATMPGETRCETCPDSDVTEFNVNAGTDVARLFEGTVTNAEGNGIFFIDGPGTNAVTGTIPTDETGSFSFNAPLFCGEQLVKCIWSNAAGQYVLVVRVVTTDCVQPDIRVTLSWDEAGSDWDVHLLEPAGVYGNSDTDCHFRNCQQGDLDWGMMGDATDNPRLTIDDTGRSGLEDIFLARPETGTYTVMIEHDSEVMGPSTSDGVVTINVRGTITVLNVTDFANEHVRRVATIEWPAGTVTPQTDEYDCSTEMAPAPLEVCD